MHLQIGPLRSPLGLQPACRPPRRVHDFPLTSRNSVPRLGQAFIHLVSRRSAAPAGSHPPVHGRASCSKETIPLRPLSFPSCSQAWPAPLSPPSSRHSRG